MRATGLSMRRFTNAWIVIGSATRCTPCCERKLRTLEPLEDLRQLMPQALEGLFAGWEPRWRECRECLPEVTSAVQG
jgi:hypothetical protein